MRRAETLVRTPVALALPRMEAAAACGISPNYFDALVASGALPKGRRLPSDRGGKSVWIVEELRAALMDLPEDGEQAVDMRREARAF